ncbi:MAG: restriction endonuclease subunit S [Syntrophales bacterium]|nr:restriction endonuclease subunit S [Syntrophales bacterium]
MELKPGYKQTEIGVIPEDWHVDPLVCLSTEIGDGIHSTPSYVRSSEFFFVNGNNLINDSITITDNTMCVNESEYKALRKNLTDRTLLLSINGTIGNVAFYRGEKVVLGKSAAYINVSREVSRKFISYCLKSWSTAQFFENELTGTTIKNLSLQSLRNTPIPLPPTQEEQRAIAAALSDVDALIGVLDRLIVKKRDLKQAAMQQLLTGQTRLPGFSGAWEVKRFGDFGNCLRGVSYKGDADLSPYDTESTIRLLRANNIQNAGVVISELQFVNKDCVSSQQVLMSDDILICMANGSKDLVGKAARFNMRDGHCYTFGAFMGCFRVNKGLAQSIFVSFLFQTGRYRNYIANLIAGSSINNLRPGDIESLEFITPPKEEQTTIAAVLSDMDAEIAALEARRDKTRALKQGMMQELLTGRTRLL